MWAYYADSHKGVCMKLDLLAQPLLFCPISHVGYDRSYHVADISEHPSDVFFRSVMLKKPLCGLMRTSTVRSPLILQVTILLIILI